MVSVDVDRLLDVVGGGAARCKVVVCCVLCVVCCVLCVVCCVLCVVCCVLRGYLFLSTYQIRFEKWLNFSQQLHNEKSKLDQL